MLLESLWKAIYFFLYVEQYIFFFIVLCKFWFSLCFTSWYRLYNWEIDGDKCSWSSLSIPCLTSLWIHSPGQFMTLWNILRGPRREWLANTPGDSAAADVCTTLSESQPRPQNEMSRCSWLFSEKPSPRHTEIQPESSCLDSPFLQHIRAGLWEEYFASDICHQISHTPGRLGPFLSSLHVGKCCNASIIMLLECCL